MGAAGANVVLADLGEGDATMTYAMSGRTDLEEATREVEAEGRRAIAVPCDVTRGEEVEALVEATRAEFGRIDLVVNNAGVVHFAPVGEIEESQWDRLYAVNVKGVFLVSRAVLPSLIESKGSVVNLASVAGKRGYPLGALYCSSKFAVVGLTQALAMEVASQGVRVNAICPGILATDMWSEHLASDEKGGRAAYDAAVTQSIPLGREQTPQDIAEAVLYLATAQNVTGVALNVAGGMEVW